MSSLAAFSAGFCVKVWSFIVGAFLFIPRLVHNLAVRPDDDQDHGGGHVLVWEFGQVRRLLHPFSRVASPPALGRSVGRSTPASSTNTHTDRPHLGSTGVPASAVSSALARLQDEEPG